MTLLETRPVSEPPHTTTWFHQAGDQTPRPVGVHATIRPLIHPTADHAGSTHETNGHDLDRLGPLGPLLADPGVSRIVVNGPGPLFVDRLGDGERHAETHEAFDDTAHLVGVLTHLIDTAGTGDRFDPDLGVQDILLSDGTEIQIFHAELTADRQPVVVIAKATRPAPRTLGELAEAGTLSRPAARFLRVAAKSGASIVFAGPPGSGRTTLLGCWAAETDATQRIVSIEDTPQLDLDRADIIRLRPRPASQERPAIDQADLLARLDPLAPDVVLLGEILPATTASWLGAIRSGVAGATTICASSCDEAIDRLSSAADRHDRSGSSPDGPPCSVASIDLIVQVAPTAFGPRVRSIVAIEDPSGPATSFGRTRVFERGADHGELRWTGRVPARLDARLRLHGHDTTSAVASPVAGTF